MIVFVTLNLFQGIKDADHKVATRQMKTIPLLVK